MLLPVMLVTWCEGRIGKTLEECKARYGEPVTVSKAFEGYRGVLSATLFSGLRDSKRKSKGSMPAKSFLSALGFKKAGFDALMKEVNRKGTPEPTAD